MDIYKIREQLMQGKSIYDLPLRVTYYARVSSEKEVQLNSLENQKYYYPKFIKNIPNWTFINGYVDEGISASSTLKRDNFLKMIIDSKTDMFDLILTKEISRFSRDTLDSIKYARELLKCGVGILFESDNINTLFTDAELRLTIMASIAQDELRKLSERVRFGMKRSIEQKKVLGNNNIYGFNKNKCKLEIDAKEVNMVRELFNIYSTGKYGFKKISEIMYKNGYTNRRGGRLDTSTLTRMIRNPKYKGYYCTNTVARLDYKNSKQIRIPQEEWKTFECKENIPQIIPEEIWNRCNKILKSRSDSFKNKQEDKEIFKNRYAFSSLIYCGEHEKNCTYHRISGKKRKVWACQMYIKQGLKSCKSPILKEEDLYRISKRLIRKYINNTDEICLDLLERYNNLSENNDIDKELKIKEKKLELSSKKKEKILELLLEGYIENKEFAEKNKELNDEINRYELEISNIKENNNNIKDQVDLKKYILDELTFEKDIEEYIKILIEKIVVNKIDGDRKKVKMHFFLKSGKEEILEYNQYNAT